LPTTLDDPFYRSLVDPTNAFPTIAFSQPWVSLYTSWNLAFVLGDLDDLHMLVPKLLIPSVLSATPANYMSTRTLALWLAGNSFIFRRLDGVEASPQPANHADMTRVLGEINAPHARELALQSAGLAAADFDAGFDTHFRWPTTNLLKLMATYVRA
jgi:hypothetical protein